MNCNKVSNLLSAYMDGELLGHEHRLIHHHLQRCNDCRAEYEELLQMKRLLAAMRMRDPGRRLGDSIVQRISMEAPEPTTLTIGDWRLPIPAFGSRPLFYSPIIGLSVGLAFFGLLFWAHPTAPVGAMDGSHRALVFEPADLTADEPPPHVADLTNGLMRESLARPVSFERRNSVDMPDFPLEAHRHRPERTPVMTTALYR